MPRKNPIAADPTAIGAVAAPPFVRLPDPHSLFSLRAMRFGALAPSSGVRPYLELLSDLAERPGRGRARASSFARSG